MSLPELKTHEVIALAKVNSGKPMTLTHGASLVIREFMTDPEKRQSSRFYWLMGLYWHVKAYIENHADPVAATQEMHLLIDKLVAMTQELHSEAASRLSCKRGCSNCCKQFVATSVHEGALLAQVKASRATLEKQSQWDATSEAWAKQYPKSTCAFLSWDGACAAYERRPSVCRTFNSISNPENCLPNSGKGMNVMLYPEAEMVASATMSFGTTSIPRAILIAG